MIIKVGDIVRATGVHIHDGPYICYRRLYIVKEVLRVSIIVEKESTSTPDAITNFWPKEWFTVVENPTPLELLLLGV